MDIHHGAEWIWSYPATLITHSTEVGSVRNEYRNDKDWGRMQCDWNHGDVHSHSCGIWIMCSDQKSKSHVLHCITNYAGNWRKLYVSNLSSKHGIIFTGVTQPCKAQTIAYKAYNRSLKQNGTKVLWIEEAEASSHNSVRKLIRRWACIYKILLYKLWEFHIVSVCFSGLQTSMSFPET